jgi:membrane protein implicated in regulation of membrane protease activity
MELTAFIESLGFWVWFIVGLLLVILEVFISGAVLMWLGVAAFVVGVVAFFAPDLDWRYQLTLFAVLSVVSVFAARKYMKAKAAAEPVSKLNRRGQNYVGREYKLSEAIVDGNGRIKVDDGAWRVRGPDLPVDARVRVTDVDGTVLIVEEISV